jgi:hypothetical protein
MAAGLAFQRQRRLRQIQEYQRYYRIRQEQKIAQAPQVKGYLGATALRTLLCAGFFSDI